MENSNLIKISTSTGLIKVASKCAGEVFFHDIQLKVFWGYCWWQGLPLVECFLELLEAVIKNNINEVLPHEELFLDYDIETNGLLEESSKISITFNYICADDTEFELVDNNLILEGLEYRGLFSRLTSFRRNIKENIQKTI